MSDNREDTSVNILDMDLDALINPGSASIMLPEDKDAKPNLFSRPADISLDFLKDKDTPAAGAEGDNKGTTDEPELDENGKPKATSTVTNVLDDIVTGDDDPSKSANGRPKVEKDGLIELTTKLIESNLLIPFDDEKPIEKYTLQDFEDLYKENENFKKVKYEQEAAKTFWESMPDEIQYVGKYLAEGGQDLKGLFKSLAAVEEVKSLDPKNENDQRNIVRSYLQATNFGTSEDIEEEINSWEDRGELEAKANKFKPKLDAMSERQVQFKLQQQEQMRQQQSKQAQLYMDNVYKTLEPGELNGLKLDKKTQNQLFAGLVQPSYSSVSGKQTNLLGHLLEKYQFLEPNHGLVAEALWLLADPDGYKNKVREVAKKEVVSSTVRQLKTEEKSKIASHVQDDESDTNSRGTGSSNKLARPSKDFFKR